MRLWHEALIPKLPRAQLLGQHRECCALRGLGWNRPHATVNYVFQHPYEYLVQYHRLVTEEMERRGYHVDPAWWDPRYRGRRAPLADIDPSRYAESSPIYPEHDDRYLADCLENLRAKGILLESRGGF
ncbi:TIGR02328 family protein [Alicyclobacillus sendaiensis]|uniref:TIGR02328 family protein n=1 Tax=Alicyclobacillus sendaiensis TaxID=192387 RepID=UPI000781FAD8|nr:TIGR02328 family protein [Alicyclobacillus sendaiensis]